MPDYYLIEDAVRRLYVDAWSPGARIYNLLYNLTQDWQA
jgi:hypothetical protein